MGTTPLLYCSSTPLYRAKAETVKQSWNQVDTLLYLTFHHVCINFVSTIIQSWRHSRYKVESQFFPTLYQLSINFFCKVEYKVDTKLISRWYNFYQPCINFVAELNQLCYILVSILCHFLNKVDNKVHTKLTRSWYKVQTKLLQSLNTF